MMSATRTPSEEIAAVVASWPGVEVDRGEIGEIAFAVGPRQLGHLHGDHAAHFTFPPPLWRELRAEGRIVPHPVFPDKTGPAARIIAGETDVRDVITLLRTNYDRIVARHGLPAGSGAPTATPSGQAA
jgi:hypothetical protein